MLILLLHLAYSLTCDLTLDAGLCISSGINVVRPSITNSGLQGYWSFDDTLSLDSSGNGNHGSTSVSAGNPISLSGSSAKFEGTTFTTIPNSATLTSDVFSFTFWLFLLPEESINQVGLRWCPILQKGEDDESNKIYSRTPAIFIDRTTRKLKVYISSTEAKDYPEGEVLESNARVVYNRWTHISVIRSTLSIKLYVNGIADTEVDTHGWTQKNEGKLYVGNTPSKVKDCPVALMIDELKFYNTEISEEIIYGETAAAFGQVESRFAKLGCLECTLETASNSCDQGYHLCTTIELHSAGYEIIRILGWNEISPMTWSFNALGSGFDSSALGLGLCCLDLGY